MEALVTIFTSESTSKQDPQFVADMGMARSRRASFNNGEALLPFRPAGSVLNSKAFGYTIFQEKGLVTSDEYEDIVERAPSDIKLSATKAPWSGEGKEDTMYLIDLRGLPLDIILSLRRVKQYFDSRAAMHEEFLNPQIQLTKDQAQEQYKHVLDMHMKARPEKLRPGAGKPYTVQQLQKMHEEADSSRSAALEIAKKRARKAASDSGSDSSDGSGGDSSEDEAPQEVEAGTLSGSKKQKAPPKKNASKKAIAAMPPPSLASTRATSSATKALADGGEDISSVRSGGSKGNFAGIDDDMIEVAEKHLATPQGSSVKCLQQMKPKAFLLGPADILLPDHSLKSMAAAIVGARCFETLPLMMVVLTGF